MTIAEVMAEWPGWADVEPVIDGPEVVPSRCSSQWSSEQASGRVVESRSLSKWVALALSTMTTRGERIVRLWFGFDGHGAMTKKEIAKEIGCGKLAVSSSLNSVYHWYGRFRRIATEVLSDYPDRQCRNNLARLIEKSALMRIDEPARVAERQARSAVRAETMELAKIAEAMRLQFRLAMYGKTFFAVSRRRVRAPMGAAATLAVEPMGSAHGAVVVAVAVKPAGHGERGDAVRARWNLDGALSLRRESGRLDVTHPCYTMITDLHRSRPGAGWC